MIEFQKITEENLDAILRMRGPADTEELAASPAESLAEAWFYNDPEGIHPFAVCEDGKPVGFMQLGTAPDCRNLCLWHIFFPEAHTGKGYGGQAIRLLARLARESGKFDAIGLCCHPDNLRAIHVYEREGFRPTGDKSGGEIDMVLKL